MALSAAAFVVLAAASWAYILSGDSGIGDLVSAKGWSAAAGFVGDLAGRSSSGTPAFLRWSEWVEAAALAYRTLAMSVLAIVAAGAGVMLTFLPAARRLGSDDASTTGHPLRRVLYYVVRAVFIVTRGTPELLMAMIVIFFFSPGIVPGAIALGLHNYGIVARLTAEVVENLDHAPARALRASGAGNMQVLLYAILPQAIPQFITYLLYRWEVIIRTTVVVGFVSAGGLGREFTLRLAWFHYTDVTLLIIWYLLLVAGVDLLSAFLRRVARAE